MQVSRSHQALAEKFMLQGLWSHSFVPDSLLEFVRFVYTEEEAEMVTALSATPLPAWAVARRLKRPSREVAPILESLSATHRIGSFKVKGAELYFFMMLAPGVFEAAMAQGRNDAYSREFARLFEQVYQEVFTWLAPRIRDKKFQLSRIVPIERSIDATPGLGVLALSTDRFSEMVERNKTFSLLKCSCRHHQELIENPCGKPKEVCAAMGALAELCIDKGLARRVSREEFLEAKQTAAEAGLVNLVDNVEDPMQVCSCCGCCCGVLRVWSRFNVPGLIAQSHFQAVVDASRCKGCRKCAKACPMQAIRVKGKKASVAAERCIGCGVCVLKCTKNKAVSLHQRPLYTPPAETIGQYVLNRYFEYKGYRSPYLPKLSLGAGRLLSKIVPIHLTGPQYKGQK
ncbi:MAG: 4Fe-4S dicluster domain-containing protein [bacterium]